MSTDTKPKREVQPQTISAYVHVDRRAELIAEADEKDPKMLHSFKDPNRASAQELNRRKMKLVYQDEYYGDKASPHEPVSVDGDFLVASPRDHVLNERISQELMSEQRVAKMMKAKRNQDRDEWSPQTVKRKPKRAEDIGKRDN